jgi:hypothetical protein
MISQCLTINIGLLSTLNETSSLLIFPHPCPHSHLPVLSALAEEQEVRAEMGGRQQLIRTIADDLDSGYTRQLLTHTDTPADRDPQFVRLHTLTKGQVFVSSSSWPTALHLRARSLGFDSPSGHE